MSKKNKLVKQNSVSQATSEPCCSSLKECSAIDKSKENNKGYSIFEYQGGGWDDGEFPINYCPFCGKKLNVG